MVRAKAVGWDELSGTGMTEAEFSVGRACHPGHFEPLGEWP